MHPNELIADFMEVPKCDRCQFPCGHYKFGTGIYYLPSQMEYDSSWDWLMPCLIKFRGLDMGSIEYNSWVEEIDSSVIDEYDINQAYGTLVKAIEWYNSLPTK